MQTVKKITFLGIVTVLSPWLYSALVLAQVADPQPPESQSTEPESTDNSTASTEPRFLCQFANGNYTVMYFPESQPQAYPWAVPQQLGGGWTAERRCVEISRRLEEYRPDGLLELQTGQENNYDTVCVTTQQDPTCRIVFTVPPGQDPIFTRDRVFQNLILADGGTNTQAVNTLTNSTGNSVGNSVLTEVGRVFDLGDLDIPDLGNLDLSNPTGSSGALTLDLRPFLDPSDGGTGTHLNHSPTPVGRPLNPENF